jgi:glycosyltransferase involved in cell wall biosynthesis
MPKITVGVPVYNSSALLAECLDCLVNQTFADFEILIFDNASTDATPDIVRSYAERDPRIKYHRQTENVGAMRNFYDAVCASQSPYFCWRAYDDLSSLDYLERLHDALETHPEASLAVGRIATSINGAEPIFSYEMPPLTGNAIKDIRRQLKRSNGAATYGLWRTEVAKARFHEVLTEYVTAWASDHLMIFPILLNRNFVLVPETTFIARDYSTIVRSYSRPDLAHMRHLRRVYYRIASRHIDALHLPPLDRLRVKYYAWLQLGKAIFMFRRVVMHTIRRPIHRLLGKG